MCHGWILSRRDHAAGILEQRLLTRRADGRHLERGIWNYPSHAVIMDMKRARRF